jgi:hypothetical protein
MIIAIFVIHMFAHLELIIKKNPQQNCKEIIGFFVFWIEIICGKGRDDNDVGKCGNFEAISSEIPLKPLFPNTPYPEL